MTRGELKQRIARPLGLTLDPLGTNDDVAAIEDAITDAVIDILSRTRLNARRVDITLDPSKSEFTLEQDLLKIWDISLLNADVPMEEVSLGDLARSTDFSGQYAIQGYNRIQFSGSPGTITMLYTPKPQKMTDDAHDVSLDAYGRIPDEFAPVIVNYCLWQLAPLAGDQASGFGERYRILYEGQDGLGGMGSNLGRIKLAVNRRGGTGARRARMRRRADQLIGDVEPDYWIG